MTPRQCVFAARAGGPRVIVSVVCFGSTIVVQLDEVTGIGLTAVQALIAEIGVDTSRFASDAHLVSWAKFCPQLHES